MTITVGRNATCGGLVLPNMFLDRDPCPSVIWVIVTAAYVGLVVRIKSAAPLKHQRAHAFEQV